MSPIKFASFVYSLSFAIIISMFALTGFVCTYKIQAEEECLSSNILCYECDSRYEPNCADPFELSSLSLTDQQALVAAQANSTILNPQTQTTNNVPDGSSGSSRQQGVTSTSNVNSSQQMMIPRRMPRVATCHGCCVKITSKTPEGATYVKRTCTTNLQINYFMVGLVCMKESGDRGKMCFCEQDYCNGQLSNIRNPSVVVMVLLLLVGSTMTLFGLLATHPTDKIH